MSVANAEVAHLAAIGPDRDTSLGRSIPGGDRHGPAGERELPNGGSVLSPVQASIVAARFSGSHLGQMQRMSDCQLCSHPPTPFEPDMAKRVRLVSLFEVMSPDVV